MQKNQGKEIFIQGLKANYRIIGEGKPVLILHGWDSNSYKWQKVGELLSKNNFQVLAPDLPGFGKSVKPPKSWDVDDYVEWVKDFIKKINQTYEEFFEPFFILGHSFGGRVAVKFAVKYPEKLKGLILVSSAGIKSRPSFFYRHFNFYPPGQKLKWIPGFSLLREIFYKYILRKTDYLKAKGVMKESFKKVIEEDLTPFLSQVKIKTLIVWGKKDKITPISDAYIMNKEIKNSRLEILEGIGHSPHLENPEVLVQKVQNFIIT